jgi:hypothetical protein
VSVTTKGGICHHGQEKVGNNHNEIEKGMQGMKVMNRGNGGTANRGNGGTANRVHKDAAA